MVSSEVLLHVFHFFKTFPFFGLGSHTQTHKSKVFTYTEPLRSFQRLLTASFVTLEPPRLSRIGLGSSLPVLGGMLRLAEPCWAFQSLYLSLKLHFPEQMKRDNLIRSDKAPWQEEAHKITSQC